MEIKVDGDRLYLRQLKLSDAPLIHLYLQDKEMVRFTLNIPYPYPKGAAESFIRSSWQKQRYKRKYTFAIVLKASDKIIGTIHLAKFDCTNLNAELGYWIGKPFWGKGYATEASNLMLRFAFKNLKLHKVSAQHFADNIASSRVLLKAGFKLEGLFRQHRLRDKRWHDVPRYSILSSEFK